MDFELTEDQQHLRDAVRAFLESNCPPSLVRQVYEAERGADPAWRSLWGQMVALDWAVLAVPESCGGAGASFVEVAIVAEELGRFVAPGPFLATTTQFVTAVREAGTPAQQDSLLRPVAEAGRTGTFALAESDGRWDPQAVRTVASRSAGRWVLDGRKCWVMEGASADEVVVVARAEGSSGSEGLGLFAVPGFALRSEPLEAVDPTLGLAEVVLEGIGVGPDRVLSEPGDPAAKRVIDRVLEEATIAMALSITGTCRAIFETTLQYAKDREQYGRPIGSFQALKHRLVDMYLAVERSSSLAWYAALTIAEDDERRHIAASMAKAAAGDCQRLIAQEGHQLHGGIGLTWEHDLHLFVKRVKAGDALFGSASHHRQAVARMLELAA